MKWSHPRSRERLRAVDRERERGRTNPRWIVKASNKMTHTDLRLWGDSELKKGGSKVGGREDVGEGM